MTKPPARVRKLLPSADFAGQAQKPKAAPPKAKPVRKAGRGR